MIYDSLQIYLADTVNENMSRIDRLKAIRTALEEAMLTMALSGEIHSIALNDGQSIINTTYRTPEEVTKTLTALDNIIFRIQTSINGRVSQGVSQKNLNGYY